MWRHFCKAEKGWLMVGKGQPCNWCAETEAAALAREALLESMRLDPPPRK